MEWQFYLIFLILLSNFGVLCLIYRRLSKKKYGVPPLEGIKTEIEYLRDSTARTNEILSKIETKLKLINLTLT